MVNKPCEHPKSMLVNGPRLPLLYGTSPSEVCTICGDYRYTLHTPGPWKSGPVPTKEEIDRMMEEEMEF